MLIVSDWPSSPRASPPAPFPYFSNPLSWIPISPWHTPIWAAPIKSWAQQDHMDAALRRAFAFRNHTGERAKLDISSAYYQSVTNQPGEAIQVCQVWAQTHPHDFTPHRILGFEYALLGHYDQSAQEFQTAMELDPSQPQLYAGLMLDDLALKTASPKPKPHSTRRRAGMWTSRNLTVPAYPLAFLAGDKQTMTNAAASVAGQTRLSERGFGRGSCYRGVLWAPRARSGIIPASGRRGPNRWRQNYGGGNRIIRRDVGSAIRATRLRRPVAPPRRSSSAREHREYRAPIAVFSRTLPSQFAGHRALALR
jgi:hypothetical protein